MAVRWRKVAVGAAICALGLAALSGGSAVAATKVTVSTATVPGIGTVLVDASGHTLYTLTDANGAAEPPSRPWFGHESRTTIVLVASDVGGGLP